jgi:t-SNARE complex subunit (syntaxin)
MDIDVEAANDDLKNEAKHAMEVRKKTGNCYLYICIIVLLVILIFLLILSYQ